MAQCRQGVFYGWLRRWPVALQQGVEVRQPMPLAHQRVGSKRWQTMLLANFDSLGIGQGGDGRIVHQALLHMTQAGHQAQVIGQRMPLGQTF
ncbi:hypothetical protein D3C85_1406470 [compost metagenome]